MPRTLFSRCISIHSARVGGDLIVVCVLYKILDFNPLRPCGRRLYNTITYTHNHNFNPLRPCGRRLFPRIIQNIYFSFQSTPPVWAETAKETSFLVS